VTAPQPGNPPDPDLVPAAAWAQPSELPFESQGLHTYDTWCAILGMATDILWAATGRRWRNTTGTETVTLDPPDGGCGSWLWAEAAARWGYGWRLMPDPARPYRVRLPRPDVTAVTSVTLDGDPFTAYRLDRNWVKRTDGPGWPLLDTTRITYTFGRPVPPPGQLAVIILAAELGKAMAGKACQLPARVTSVTRQGVSFDVLESIEVLKENLTGIHSVDSFIRAANPRGVAQKAQVWSPDVDLVTARKV
jgi:hypothetical protein